MHVDENDARCESVLNKSHSALTRCKILIKFCAELRDMGAQDSLTRKTRVLKKITNAIYLIALHHTDASFWPCNVRRGGHARKLYFHF